MENEISPLKDNRLKLHEEFCDILGSRNVYYRKPPSTGMKYPAILYSRSKPKNFHANNAKYLIYPCYSVTYISRSTDDMEVQDIIDHFRYVEFDRSYESSNLNHDVFTIYYGGK